MTNARRVQVLNRAALTLILTLKISAGWSQPVSSPQASSPSPARDADGADVSALTSTPKVDTPSAPPKPKGPPPPPPVATLSCTPELIKMGEPALCVVEVVYPETMSVQVITPPNTKREASTPPMPQADGSLITRRAFSVRHYDPDRPLRIKNLSVTWSAVGGHSGIVRLPHKKINVTSILTGVSQPNTRDFVNPLGVVDDQSVMALSRPKAPTPQLNEARENFWVRHAPPSLQMNRRTLQWLLWALIGVIVSVLVRAVARFMASLRKDEGPYVDPRPAHVIALSELNLLAQARLIEAGAHKPYSLRISEIMRAYFGRRYDFAGLEMTSDEVREILANMELDDAVLITLDQFLSDTDLIKFADFTTSASALEELAQQAHRMIDLTREREEEVTVGEEGEVEEEVHQSDEGREKYVKPLEPSESTLPKDDPRFKASEPARREEGEV